MLSYILDNIRPFLQAIPRHLGKILGALIPAIWMRDPLASLIGLGLGYIVDKGLWETENSPMASLDKLRGRKRIAFLRVLFNVMGHIAKADGRVSEDEIKVARGIMAELGLSKDEVDMAIRAFTDGKNPDFPLASTLTRFYEMFSRNINLREWFVRVQIQAALAGDGLSPVVDKLLQATAAQIDIPRVRVLGLVKEARIYNSFSVYGRKTEKTHYERQRDHQRTGHRSRYRTDNDEGFSRQRRQSSSREQREYADPVKHRQNQLAEAYILLGVSAADDEKAIKRAYRRLLSQHHPDKVVGKGGNSAERELANAKTIEIRNAYELICETRGF